MLKKLFAGGGVILAGFCGVYIGYSLASDDTGSRQEITSSLPAAEKSSIKMPSPGGASQVDYRQVNMFYYGHSSPANQVVQEKEDLRYVVAFEQARVQRQHNGIEAKNLLATVEPACFSESISPLDYSTYSELNLLKPGCTAQAKMKLFKSVPSNLYDIQSLEAFYPLEQLAHAIVEGGDATAADVQFVQSQWDRLRERGNELHEENRRQMQQLVNMCSDSYDQKSQNCGIYRYFKHIAENHSSSSDGFSSMH